MSLLDNQKILSERIPEKMLKILYEFPVQFRKAWNIVNSQDFTFDRKFKNAIILAVGSSTNTAYRLMNSIDIDKINIPIIINSRHTIPSWVSEDTLAIAVTHSGDTIEILEAADKALASKA
ncbi:MAG: hypothetical protein PHC87_02660, partial [Actinomycetota bacterium]|nr:hypothetical protein [Actinomycetota bacterium]